MFEVTRKQTISTIYRQIAEELRNQYRIGFTPADTSAGYHDLAVTLPHEKKLLGQARQGFYTVQK